MRDDWYCNDGNSYYLQLAGTYYKRTENDRWQVISKEQAPGPGLWSPVHPLQWEHLVDTLIAQGLLTGNEWWVWLQRKG